MDAFNNTVYDTLAIIVYVQTCREANPNGDADPTSAQLCVCDPGTKRCLQLENSLWKTMRHKDTIPSIGVMDDEDNVVLEARGNGSLTSFLKRKETRQFFPFA